MIRVVADAEQATGDSLCAVEQVVQCPGGVLDSHRAQWALILQGFENRTAQKFLEEGSRDPLGALDDGVHLRVGQLDGDVAGVEVEQPAAGGGIGQVDLDRHIHPAWPRREGQVPTGPNGWW